MFKLSDFHHLPRLDQLFQQMVAEASGVIVVAGVGTIPTSEPALEHAIRPSGRAGIFSILVNQVMESHPELRGVVIAEDKSAFRIPRQYKRRFQLITPEKEQTIASLIAEAIRRKPALLVLDQLDEDDASLAFAAANRGAWVLAQLDSVARGASAARQLVEMGVPLASLAGVTWVIAIQRMEKLCQQCKKPHPETGESLVRIAGLLASKGLRDIGSKPAYPGESRDDQPGEIFYQATGCTLCHNSGRSGDVAVFDVYRAPPDPPWVYDQPSLLSMEEYVYHLARQGVLALDDLARLDSDLVQQIFRLMRSSEKALAETEISFWGKLAELEAANRVLRQRTEVLVSLQDIGQVLASSIDLDEVAALVCRRARELCNADLAVLYFLRAPDTAEVIAVGGWDAALLHRQLDAGLLFASSAASKPTPYLRLPPGVELTPQKTQDSAVVPQILAGLQVPLVAQGRLVGQMIVQSTQKPQFTPGEVALLQTFANQAALGIQRAGLVEQLRQKIALLEVAQAELVRKERIEHELELARQVQQSLLPRTFPDISGFVFIAWNEPARQVGGDFYDVISLDENRFGVVVADVSDKGMPAALYMALTRSLLLAEARREMSPRQVLSNVNQLLQELGEPNMFVSVFYGVIDRPTRRMTFTRAGHNRPVLLRDGKTSLLSGMGAVLGLLPPEQLNLSEEQIELEAGDRLVMYTDGLTDVVNPQGQFYDLERLLRSLQAHSGLSLDDLCKATVSDMIAFQGSADQHDDMTLLAVEMLP